MNLHTVMNEVVELAARLDQLLSLVDRRDQLNVTDRIRNAYNGWPASSGRMDTSRSARVDDDKHPILLNDPTGDAAVRPDRARDDEQFIHRQLETAKRALDAATGRAQQWTLKDATAWHATQTNSTEPGCLSCARVRGPRSRTWWNPIHRTTTLANGACVPLCRWCYDWARRAGQLPPVEAVEAHRDGTRVRLPA